MLDASAIIATIMGSIKSSQSAQTSLSGEFTSGMSGMNLSGPESSTSVMSSTAGGCKDMSAKMNSAFASLQSDLNSHLKMLQGEMPADFKMPKGDLLNTTARGFPEEKPEFLSGKKNL